MSIMLARRLYSTSFNKIGIVGCGTIGTSWALLYLLKGFQVVAYDQNKAIEPRMQEFFKKYEETVKASEITEQVKANLSNFKFTESLKDLHDVEFVQESGPEDVEIKRALYKELESTIEKNVIVASSSSGILPSKFQEGAQHPERILLGHPFNPPHIMPLVEICGGKLTEQKYVDQAKELYDSMGKSTVVLKKEIEGHIANRYQAAILQEVLSLLEQGVASAEDLDKALVDGPGLRWAVYGQLLNFHLGGGPEGIRRWFNYLGPAYLKMTKDLEQIAEYSPDMVEKASKGVEDVIRKFQATNEDLINGRDRVVLNIIANKKKFSKIE